MEFIGVQGLVLHYPDEREQEKNAGNDGSGIRLLVTLDCCVQGFITSFTRRR
jgi:hypothetical protein